MFTGVHTNSHVPESADWDSVEPAGSGIQAYIITASPSGSLVVNVTEVSSITVHCRVCDPFTLMKGTLFAAAANVKAKPVLSNNYNSELQSF